MKALGLKTLAAIAALSAAGCKEMDNPAFAPADQSLPTAEQVMSGPPTQPGPEQPLVDKAKAHFKNGEYGLAERYFRQAVELRHRNLEAWLGLAASLDHLKRFDEADRAYSVLQKMVVADADGAEQSGLSLYAQRRIWKRRARSANGSIERPK